MEFIRSVEAIMADSGLSETLEYTFGGNYTMLSGKIH